MKEPENISPPKLADKLLRVLLPDELAEELQGDMHEQFELMVEEKGLFKARWLYVWEVLRFCRPYFLKRRLIRKTNEYQQVSIFSTIMISNYFKIAWRNLRKNMTFGSINLFGLVTGLTTCLLIFLYVSDELSFDQYHTKADRIYRIDNELKFNGNHYDMAVSSPAMGQVFKGAFPEIENYVRLRWLGDLIFKKDGQIQNVNRVAFADSTLFEIFTFKQLAGNLSTALNEPNAIVLTKKIALKLYNSTNIVGQNFVSDNKIYKVTAVIDDIPKQTHYNFDAFVPMQNDEWSRKNTWLSQNYNTYLLLRKDANVMALERKLYKMNHERLSLELKAVINQTLADFLKGGGLADISLMPVRDIHLRSHKVAELDGNGNPENVYIFSVIGFLILLLASFNYTNLSTAVAASRAKEVGMRKVMGSGKLSIVMQFLTESFALSFIALFISYALLFVLLPSFNELAGKSLAYAEILQPGLLLSSLALMFALSLFSGAYPAFYISSFVPSQVLKGKVANGFRSGWFRNSLVVFQFSITIILLIGTIVIYRQLDFIKHKDLGFNRNQVLILHNMGSFGDKTESFKKELLTIAGVEKVALSDFLPVNNYRSNNTFFKTATADVSGSVTMQNWWVDEDYLSTLGIKLLKGRNFSKEFGTDSSAIILNEIAAKKFGGESILNKQIFYLSNINSGKVGSYTVIGIVKNFNFSNLREEITPLSFIYSKQANSLSLKISSQDLPGVISQVESKWKARVPEQAMNYSFMDEDFNRQYDVDRKTGKIATSFALLAILIASLGLLGLVLYAVELRTKEIGIRKVLGASIRSVYTLLTREFMVLVAVAMLVAFPAGYYLMHRWLQDFAYHIDIEWWVFAVAGAFTIGVALLTVSYQAIKAALMNPVRSLKSE
ncbi:FtsX-like permease family protein [Emticicia sp. 21SJ11W-3]|uniref:FtsX-like permease family protein n=1 Tax=Emticicia sp. 21SJ11W-3 TaxID=2916755 RepID=UPI00209EF862|nr:FtsX-like permease family protein [Emticicia sp. 21SJ11W-3]UTA66715.1 permease prefix domain 2-containing transporter [Emticicia sp. 21SJ11W-3]